VPEITSSNHWHRPGRLKACIRCGESKALNEFYQCAYTRRDGIRSTRYESRCKDCAKERRKERSRANPGMDADISRKRRQEKPDWYPQYNRERQKLPEVKALKAYHQRLRKARMRAQAGDNAEIREIYAEAMRIEQIVACCPVFDLPELGKKMHVDHIRPLARGGRHVASNLQILPIGINMRKGTKCPR
jgi:5-methylcytosine-specific restriction endonuclease McrA